MLFAIGTKVKLKHTGEIGEITEMLGDGMLNVWIDSLDTEIPVFEEDLVRAEDYTNTNHKAKIITTPKPVKKVVQYEVPDVETTYTILKSQGLQLAFDPVEDENGFVAKYQVFLINNTNTDFIFSLKVNHRGAIHGKLATITTYQLSDLLFDQLNDSPVYELEAWPITTEGTGTKQQKTLKIKAKQFFKKVKTAPLLNRPVHLYTLFDKAPVKSNHPRENLKDYTKKNTRPVRLQQLKNQPYKVHDVQEYANFSGEIDLHIENLFSQKGKMNNAEKLQLQLEHFDRFMDKAIRLGVPRVFVIHGIGKGRLRDLIASRLIQMREVKTFKNEYHPRYGWGATEVIF
ncbi:MAG: Smr/MutS family protein [Bacteroidota bacterium]